MVVGASVPQSRYEVVLQVSSAVVGVGIMANELGIGDSRTLHLGSAQADV